MASTAEIQKLCADYLGGKWEQFCDEIQVQNLALGFCNNTYRCSLIKADPNDVIVKIFGTDFTAVNSVKIQGLVGEMIVFHILSVHGLAPKLLAAFDSGRIEEFVYGRNVTNEDFFSDHSLLSSLAKKLVKYHRQSMPVSKQINYINKILLPFNATKLEKSIEDFPETKRIHVKNLFDFPVKNEVEWLVKYSSRIKSKVVFCHHDFRADNILLRDSFSNEDDRLVLVDYEISGYDYRGFDIGFFLLFLRFRVAKSDHKIIIELNGDLNTEIEKLFIEAYLNELRKLNDFNDEFDNYDHLLMEANYFSLQAMLAMFSFSKALINTPSFCNAMESLAYLTDLISNYHEKKQLFVKSYPTIFQ